MKRKYIVLISIVLLLMLPMIYINSIIHPINKKNGSILDQVPVNSTDWTPNGTAVCFAPSDQGINYYFPPSSPPESYDFSPGAPIISDGAGGAIIAWMDSRDGWEKDIYVQRVDSTGTPLWAPNGTAVRLASRVGGVGKSPTLCSDGAGGAIIVWACYRGSIFNYYAQRVNSEGIVQWTEDGVKMQTGNVGQMGQAAQICSDGQGGAIITWWNPFSGYYTIFAQRINSTGALQWNESSNGVLISTVGGHQYNPRICSDGLGGAIIIFKAGAHTLYSQRINSTGTVQWGAIGVQICGATSIFAPTIVSDGASGAVICWMDQRDADGWFGIYAQRVNMTGMTQWTSNGVEICDNVYYYGVPYIGYMGLVMCTDGAGGAIIAWEDSRNCSPTFPDYLMPVDIYAQCIDATGAIQWTPNGIAIATGPECQEFPQICTDGNGGAFITWQDNRSGEFDIYKQWVTFNGTLQFDGDDTELCTVAGEQGYPTVCYDGSSGAIIAWVDDRSGTFDIYIGITSPNPSVFLDAIIDGNPNNDFDQASLLKSDTNYHEINSTFSVTQETVTVQYGYEYRGLKPYFIQNLTIRLTYASPLVQHRLIIDLYNFTSATWDNVDDKGGGTPLIGGQDFQWYVIKNGLYHYFNDTTLLVRVQMLDRQSSTGFQFLLDRLTVQYKTSIHLEVVEHLENGLPSPPGLPQLSESGDFNVALTVQSRVGNSYGTWMNVSIFYRINSGLWNSSIATPLHALGTANFIIGAGNYSTGDDVYYFIKILQFFDDLTTLQEIYWTQDGIKYDMAEAQLVAFRKPVYPVLYELSLNYSVFYRAQIEKNLRCVELNETIIQYPWIYVAYENFTLDFYNITNDLTTFNVTSANESKINHYIDEASRNISKYDDPQFYDTDGIKSPFVLSLNTTYINHTSIITVPELAFDKIDLGRNLVFTGNLFNLTYNGIEGWPYPYRSVLKFSDGPDRIMRFDAFTGIMVYYRCFNDTVNASKELTIGLVGNNQSYPINLFIDRRFEVAESGEVFDNATLFEILHDPPGDHSYSMLKTGTTVRKGISVEGAIGGHQFARGQVVVGWAGVGVEEDYKWYDSFDLSYDKEVEWTFTKTLTTSLESEDPALIGPGRGDLYYFAGTIIQFFLIVKNFYIVLNTPDLPNNQKDDILLYTNRSHVEYSLGVNTSAAVLGAYLDDYNVSYFADKNVFADNTISSEEESNVEYVDTVLWTPGNTIEYAYEVNNATTDVHHFGNDFSLDAYFIWDYEQALEIDVFLTKINFGKIKSYGEIGGGFSYYSKTINTSSTTTNNEIMVHLEDDDAGPSGEYDQFLVYLYEDKIYNTYGVIFDQNYTYTSRPYESGTKDRRSPTVSEIMSLEDYVSGVITLTCNAVDEETGVDIVKFYYDDDPTFDMDSVQFGYQDNSTILDPNSYQLMWDTTVFHGTYYLFAAAYDNAAPLKNFKISAAYLIRIDNLNPILSQILAYGPYRGAIDLYANAFDADSGILFVEYWDGDPDLPGSTLLGISYDSSSAYHFIWATNPTGSNDGMHYLYTRAYDKAGNYLTSVPIEITVNNSAAGEPSESTDWLPITVIVAGAAIASALILHALLLRSRPTAPPPKKPLKNTQASTPSHKKEPAPPKIPK